MEVKRYRAATMREALEQIKQDLGEEALVLDTKRVKSGGFLGVGTQELIEVRAALGLASASSKHIENRAKKREAGLDLTDNAPAVPDRFDEKEFIPSTRAIYSQSFDSSSMDLPKLSDGNSNRVEIANTEPRFVYTHPTPPPANASTPQESNNLPSNNPPNVTRNSVSRELERLRAEMREIKFSLNNLTSISQLNQKSAIWQLQQGTPTALDTNPEMYDSPYYETYINLTSTGIEPELARLAVGELIKKEVKNCSDALELAELSLTNLLPALITFADDPLIPNSTGTLPTIAFVGPTGVGKTTTIAKLAARLALRERRRVELITLDTYRIAAVEQLKTYAEIIGAGCHIARSVVELDALRRKYEETATILIDTIGRSPQDLSDQIELADYLRESEDVYKCLAIPASLNPIDAQAVIKKFGLYGASHLVLTKLDETIRPGASISVIANAPLPIVYLCTGQRVPEDIERATPENLAARVLNRETLAH